MMQPSNSLSSLSDSYQIVVNSPSGEPQLIKIETNSLGSVDQIQGNVVRIIRGNVIDVVTGNRVVRVLGKNIVVSDDYNVVSGSEVHLNPEEFRKYNQFSQQIDQQITTELEGPCESCHHSSKLKKICRILLLGSLWTILQVTVVILLLYLLKVLPM